MGLRFNEALSVYTQTFSRADLSTLIEGRLKSESIGGFC